MAIPTSNLREQRYLGDAEAMRVHDLMHEDPTPKGCRTLEIVKSGRGVRFEPDSLRQAASEGYQTCPKCFFGLEMRRAFVTRELVDKAEKEEE